MTRKSKSKLHEMWSKDNLEKKEREMIDELMEYESRLTDFEQEFLESISNQEYPLTVKQKSVLNEIYDRRMDPWPTR